MKISIITPLHNKGKYIAETIESVLGQTYIDWEMIIVENHSDDDGPVIAREYVEKDNRILFFEASPEIKGPGAARNFGLKHATGEWVLFLDADDLIEHDHLKNLLTCATNHPEAKIIAGGWKEFDACSEFNSQTIKMPPRVDDGGFVLKAFSIAFCPWAVHATILKKSLLNSYSLSWPEELDRYLGEDIAFWFQVIHHGVTVCSPHSGALYRINTENCRTKIDDAHKWSEGIMNAVAWNIRYLNKVNGILTENMCEYIIRSYYELLVKMLNLNLKKDIQLVRLQILSFYHYLTAAFLIKKPRLIVIWLKTKMTSLN